MRNFSVIFMILLLLVGCTAPEPALTPSPSPVATATTKPIVVTPTKTATPVVESTPVVAVQNPLPTEPVQKPTPTPPPGPIVNNGSVGESPRPSDDGTLERVTATAEAQIPPYTIQSGDQLSQIAVDFDVAVEELARLNNIVNYDSIYVGQEIIFPGWVAEEVVEVIVSDSAEISPTARPTIDSSRPLTVYTIEGGDSLQVIAELYETSMAHLQKLNRIDNPDTIYVGQQILVPIVAEE